MTDTILKLTFVVAAIILIGGGFARAGTLEDMERGVAEDTAYARSMPAETPSIIPPNPYAGSYQPPIETTLQNQEFINQSYRR